LLACTTLAGIAPTAATAQNAAGEGQAEILVVGMRQNPLTLPSSTGSRLGLTLLETPASVASLDGDELRARGDLSVVDAVTRAPGITSVANPGNGGTALAARGFAGQGSVMQLVDGIRLFPVAGTITFPTDPWTVGKIDVLSGPASVLYGQGALGGAINILTKQPSMDRTTVDAEASYGMQNTKHLAAGAGGPIGSMLAYRVDASWRQSDGYVDRGDSRSYALSGALRFQPAEGLSITLRDDYGNNRPMEYFGTPLINGKLDTSIRKRNYNVSDASLYYRDNRTTLTLEWKASDMLSFSNSAYRLTSKRLFKDLESYCYVGSVANTDGSYDCVNGYATGTTPGNILRVDNLGIIHDQKQIGDQGSVHLATPFGGGMSNDLVVGFDVNQIKLTYSNDFGSDSQESEVNPRNFNPGMFFDTQGIAPRYRTRTDEYAIFAEDRLKISEQFSVVGGVRYEHDKVTRRNIVYNASGVETGTVNAFPLGQTEKNLHNTTWRVGAVYQPTPNVSLYGQYSTGVDPLGTLTTFTTNAVQFAFTNATGYQFEGGVKASFLDGKGTATLAAYKIVKKNLVAQRTPTSPIEQIGQRSAKGIEASVSLNLPYGLGIDANGTVLDPQYDDFISGGTSYKGKTPANIPKTAANLALRWDAVKRVQVRSELRYVGKTWSDDANTFRIPAYAVIDAGVSYALTQRIAIDLRLYNVFDKDYAITTYNDQQWILGRPRSVDVALRARF
jgi:iron complex outermembrane receptor protein